MADPATEPPFITDHAEHSGFICDVALCLRPASYHVRPVIGASFYCCREHYPFARLMTRAPDA